MMGHSPADVLPVLVDRGAFAVGANCTLDSHDMVQLAAQMRALVAVPLLVQPNAGQPDVRPEPAHQQDQALGDAQRLLI